MQSCWKYFIEYLFVFSYVPLVNISIHDSTEGSEGIANSKVQELIHQATDLVYGSEDQGPESVRAALATASDTLTVIATSLEKGEYDYDGTPQETSVSCGFLTLIQFDSLQWARYPMPLFRRINSVLS